MAYSYDNACRLTSVTTPFGSTSYEYDLLDRMTRVVDRNGYATVYEYDANGNRTAVHYANGFTTTYDYDLLNRLIRQETVDIDGDIVVQYIYTLGVAGERKSVTELDRTVEYTYDSLYRLTSETITEGEKTTVYTYAYDNVSNRILKTENGAATEYVYNALNQLVSDSETTYEYDLNGNLVRVIGTANSALYEYNSENKLVKATVQNGSLVIEESYTYDYEGNRTSKSTHKSNGEFEYTKYLNDNSSLTNVLAEIDENGTAKCTYTIGADLISQERDGRTSFYLYDGHGSVVGLANESGVVTDTYCYDAFGNLLKSTGSTKNCYRYCGEQFDETTGLYYLRARYMDTSTGRFISQDSYAGSISDPISLHKYLYANANPVTYSDPSGYYIVALAAGTTIDCRSTEAETRSKIKIFHELCDALQPAKVALSSFGRAFLNSASYIAPYIAAGIICLSVDTILTQIKAHVQEQISKENTSSLDNIVYTLVNPYDKTEVMYVGRTCCRDSREAVHKRDLRKRSRNPENIFETKEWEMYTIYDGLDVDGARLREQMLIMIYFKDELEHNRAEKNNGGNKIRGIASGKAGSDGELLTKYKSAGEKLTQLYEGFGESELLCILEGNF